MFIFISGVSTFQGASTHVSSLNISGASIFNNNITIYPNSTSLNALTMFCYPNSISNASNQTNSVNVRVACYTTGLATSDFIDVIVSEGYNGIDIILNLKADGGAHGLGTGSRIVLDASTGKTGWTTYGLETLQFHICV